MLCFCTSIHPSIHPSIFLACLSTLGSQGSAGVHPSLWVASLSQTWPFIYTFLIQFKDFLLLLSVVPDFFPVYQSLFCYVKLTHFEAGLVTMERSLVLISGTTAFHHRGALLPLVTERPISYLKECLCLCHTGFSFILPLLPKEYLSFVTSLI